MVVVKHAMSLFDEAHPHNLYVVSLMAQLDTGAKGWPSFMAFREQLVEHFAVKDAKAAAKAAASASLVAEHSAFVNFQRKGGSRNHANAPTNDCDHCDLRICTAKRGDPIGECEVCAPEELESLKNKRPGTEGKRIILFLRMFKADKGLTSMKGVHAPASWLNSNGHRLPLAEQRPSDVPPTESGLAAMEISGDFGGNFWDELNSTAHDSMLVSMEQAAIDEDNLYAESLEREQRDFSELPHVITDEAKPLDQSPRWSDYPPTDPEYPERDEDDVPNGAAASGFSDDPFGRFGTPKPMMVDNVATQRVNHRSSMLRTRIEQPRRVDFGSGGFTDRRGGDVQRQLLEILDNQRTPSTSSRDVPIPERAELEVKYLREKFENLTTDLRARDCELQQAQAARNDLQGTVANLIKRFDVLSQQLEASQDQNVAQAKVLADVNERAVIANEKRVKDAAATATLKTRMASVAHALRDKRPRGLIKAKAVSAILLIVLLWLRVKHPAVLRKIMHALLPILGAIFRATCYVGRKSAPAIMRAMGVISAIIRKAIGSASDRVSDISLLHNGRARDEIVISRDEIEISQD